MELAMSEQHPSQRGARTPDSSAPRVDVSEMFLQSRRLSIYGGTNEIQRNLIARRLGLPRGRA